MLRGERKFVAAGGTLYKIGEEPQTGQHFGLGFGGREYRIIWPDGTEQTTRNLWHWGDTDLADNATLMQAPFWGGNLFRNCDIEHLLQPAPHNVRAMYQDSHPNGFYCVLDEREHFAITAARERKEWANRNLLARIWFSENRPLRRIAGKLKDVPESRIRRFTRMRWYYLKTYVGKAMNAIICTHCWHWRKRHWEMGDELYGPIDWGCGVRGCKC